MSRKKRSRSSVPSVGDEFATAELGDDRRVKRLQEIARTLSAAPNRSFPEQAGSDAKLEGLYRLVENENVEPEVILRAHSELTADRVAEVKEALAIHDTSEFAFSGDVRREGLGWLGTQFQGFLFHPTFAVDAASLRPLGILAAKTWTRKGSRGKNGNKKRKADPKESGRWLEGVQAAESRLNGGGELIHVMDREGDIYELFAAMVDAKHRFVVRLTQDRRVMPESEPNPTTRLRAALEAQKELLSVTVPLSARTLDPRPHRSKSLPPRDARTATLGFAAKTITVLRPMIVKASSALPKSIEVNVVHVYEVAPPAGEEPVDWLLMTTEPIATTADVTRIVTWYRARWLIEELFKAIKTGCAFEDRQLESLHTLTNALMIFLPIAVQLLLMRHLERMDTKLPATAVLSPTQIKVLQVNPDVRLRSNPTVHDALRAIAKLGGFLKKNGQPGWLTLSRGMVKLGAQVLGWTLALQSPSEDGKDVTDP